MEGKVLKKWFLDMNYNPYKLPSDDTFKFLCQGNVGPIWQEVINVVESREKVYKIKMNLIYHSLKKNLTSTDVVPKAVELWHKKVKLENKLEEIRQNIKDAEGKLKGEIFDGKVKLIKESNLKLKNGQLKKRIYLSQKKADQITNDMNTYETRKRAIQEFLDSQLGVEEIQKRLQLIVSSLNKEDPNRQPEAKNEAPENSSFTTSNDYFIQCQVHGIKEKLSRLLKENLTSANVQVLDVITEMQRQSINALAEINAPTKHNGTLEFNGEQELTKLSAFNNEIILQIAHNQTEAEKYEKLGKNIFANMAQNSKQHEYLTAKCAEIGHMAAKNCLQHEINTLKSDVNGNANVTRLARKMSDIKANIDKKRGLIKHFFKEITPYPESIFDTQLLLKKRHAMFNLNIDHVITAWSDHFQNDLEISKFYDYPIHFSKDEYQNVNNYWRVIMDSPEIYSNRVLITTLNTPDTRPESVLIKLLEKQLKSVEEPIFETISTDFSDLRTEDYFRDQSKELLKSASKLISTSNSMQVTTPKLEKGLEFWIRQPFKDVVAESRLFESKNYKYYEKYYDSGYETLKSMLHKSK